MSFSVVVLQRFFTYNTPGTNIVAKIIMTVNYQDTALQLSNPNLTQDAKNNLIIQDMVNLRSSIQGNNVTVLSATPTGMVLEIVPTKK
jgi:hypothetical protein